MPKCGCRRSHRSRASTSVASLKRRSSSSTCAESACEPLPIDQTCRSCTPVTPRIASMCSSRCRRVDVARNAFEQHVGRVAQHAHDADDDDRRDEEREQRIDPRAMRQPDRDAADDDRQRAKRVAEDVEERRAHVEIALACSDAAASPTPRVDGEANRGDEPSSERRAVRPAPQSGAPPRRRSRSSRRAEAFR